MGQFKPMVKMETTEPSVILKLKKGGHVAMKSKGENGHAPMKKMDGGAMGALAGTPALIGRPALNAPVRAPKRPSMAARRMAMMAAQRPRMAPPAAGGLPVMKKGGKAKAGGEMETPAMHKMEMKGIKGIGKELKSHESKPASKAHAGLKTGGVVNGQGGYAKGGIIKTEKGKSTVNTATVNHNSAPTGEVKLGNAGGYKTGGIMKSPKPGEFKKGGAAKKFADGGLIDTGRAVAMPKKKPSAPVAINQLSGTFKKGGKVERKAVGGYEDDTKAYDRWKANEKAENLADRDAMKNLPSRALDLGSRLVDKLKNLGGVTNTVREVSKTVMPAKKRGGMCK